MKIDEVQCRHAIKLYFGHAFLNFEQAPCRGKISERHRTAELRLDVPKEGEERKDTIVADHKFNTYYKHLL